MGYKFIKISLLLCFMFFIFSSGFEVRAAEDAVIMVEDYSVTEDKIVPGNDFTLTIGLKNYGEVTANGVLINVQFPNGVAPVYGSVSQLYVGDIEAGEKRNISFDFESWPTIEEETLDFGVSIASGIISNYVALRIAVETDFSLNVVSYEAADTALTNQNVTFSTTFRVLGDENVRDVNAVLKVDGSIVQNTAVGILTPGTTRTQNLSTLFTNAGAYDVEVCLTYVDDLGQDQEMKVFETQVVVSEPKQSDELNNDMLDNNNQPVQTENLTDNVMMLGFAGVIILVLFLLIVILVKKRK